jgi:hypothetical protein
MRSMKLFRLAVLFLMVTALFGGRSALVALPPMRSITVPLAPVGDETEASGQAVLTKGEYDSWYLGYWDVPQWSGDDGWRTTGEAYDWTYCVTLEYQGLTPRATYSCCGATFTAGPNGKGRASLGRVLEVYVEWSYGQPSPSYQTWVPVYRLGPNSSSTLVLNGSFWE